MTRMSRFCPLFACLLFLPALGLAVDSGRHSEPVRWCGQSAKPSAKTETEETPADESTQAGLRAFVDPVTGELVDEPPPGSVTEPDALDQARVVAPQDELQVTVSADGTESVDLGDRFMTELRTEVVDGKLVTCHVPLGAPNPTDEVKEEADRNQGDERGNGH